MDSAAALKRFRELRCLTATGIDKELFDAAIAALEREQRPSSYAAVTPQTAAVGRLVEAMQPFLIVGHVEPGDERKCACRSCMLGESDRRELRDALAALTNPAREVERCPRCNAGYRHWYFTGCRSDDGWQPQHDPWHDSRPADADENKVACDCYGGTCDHTASGCPFTHPDDSQPAPVREPPAATCECGYSIEACAKTKDCFGRYKQERAK